MAQDERHFISLRVRRVVALADVAAPLPQRMTMVGGYHHQCLIENSVDSQRLDQVAKPAITHFNQPGVVGARAAHQILRKIGNLGIG